jgi:hypothetical protein
LPASPTPVVGFADEQTLVIMNSPRTLRGECCLFDVYDLDGMLLVRSFGKRHPTYDELRAANVASGFANVYMDFHGDMLAMAFGYPYEVRIYDWISGTLQDKFSIDLEYFDDEYEHRTIKAPMKRGVVGGLFFDEDGRIYVYDSDRFPATQTAEDFLTTFSADGAPLARISLTRSLGGAVPRLNSGRAIGGNRLIVEVDEPVPGLTLIELGQ